MCIFDGYRSIQCYPYRQSLLVCFGGNVVRYGCKFCVEIRFQRQHWQLQWGKDLVDFEDLFIIPSSGENGCTLKLEKLKTIVENGESTESISRV
jgi:hypothetical protein